MENIRDYIESGILELYILGDLPQAERLEVERLRAIHPEIDAELRHIEESVISYSRMNAVAPQASGRTRFLLAVDTIEDQPNVFKMHSGQKNANFYKYALAACVCLLLVSLVVILNLNNKLRDRDQRILALQSSNQKFANQVNLQEKQIKDSRKYLEVYRNPRQYQLLTLKGTDKAPNASMKIAFNTISKEVSIDLSSLNLPVLDDQHQYQLWAIVDDKPVDLGVFDYAQSRDSLLLMKSVANAKAFAVTQEKKGGSQVPTLSEMVVIGSI
ncbi:anti-sigma factor domain-containing protein [Arcticibacter sp.]|uniref:anti-sigma factor n=1 Tax=Arcticibacter sp. TaxID=1872630 RepID=UPI00388F7960